MEWMPKVYFLFFIGAICIFFVLDLTYQTFVKEDVEQSLEYAIKSSMQQSINKGDLRVSETVTIDTERFKTFFETRYDNNQSVKNAEQTTFFYAQSSSPPMAAVHTTGLGNSFFLKVIGEDEKMTANNKEIAIIERK